MARRGTKSDALIAAALAAGATHEAAALAAGVSLRTVARRVADPAFRRAVDAEQDGILERFVGGAAGKLGAVLDRLAVLTESPKDLVALGACRTLADILIRVREHASLARRLRELERAADESGGPPEGDGADDGGPPDEPPDAGGREAGSGGGTGDGEGGS